MVLCDFVVELDARRGGKINLQKKCFTNTSVNSTHCGPFRTTATSKNNVNMFNKIGGKGGGVDPGEQRKMHAVCVCLVHDISM